MNDWGGLGRPASVLQALSPLAPCSRVVLAITAHSDVIHFTDAMVSLVS